MYSIKFDIWKTFLNFPCVLPFELSLSCVSTAVSTFEYFKCSVFLFVRGCPSHLVWRWSRQPNTSDLLLCSDNKRWTLLKFEKKLDAIWKKKLKENRIWMSVWHNLHRATYIILWLHAVIILLLLQNKSMHLFFCFMWFSQLLKSLILSAEDGRYLHHSKEISLLEKL